MPAIKSAELPTEADDTLEREHRAFQRQRSRLLHSHAGEYVAYYRGRLVGHDRDDESLARRMFARFGDAPFYIARVEAEPTVWDLPSPELSR